MSRFLLPILLVALLPLRAQNKPGSTFPIKKTTGAITIDGVLDEPAWSDTFVAKDFYLNFPVDTALAPFQTEARMTFNDQFLYVAFVCYDDERPYIVQSLKRDFDFENNDNMTIEIGPYNDKQNGFFFTVSPFGVQLEGTVSTGGSSDMSYSSNWDNKWYCKSVRHKDKWIAELAIPFKSIRYKSVGEWNINFMRWDRKHNMASTWVAVPIQYSIGSFAYSGQLVWEDPAPSPSMNVSLIPYLAGGTSQDKEVNPTLKENDMQIGLDAKVAVTPSMNLDLTINPDFSQVDVDQQVINLTRFEFQFPERRQFFLENSDLFDNAGFPMTRLFFSRRIGLAKDSTEDKNLKRVPIAFGARLSGSINKKWRISAMNMQTKEKLDLGLPKQNYAVATIMRNFGHQSNISITYVDKSSLGLSDADTLKFFNEDVRKYHIVNGRNTAEFSRYSRAVSVDLELLSKDNKWYSGSYASISRNPFTSGRNFAGGVFGRFSNRYVDSFVGAGVLGKNFNSEAGFVPAYDVYPGYWSGFASFNYKLYPKIAGIAFMGPQSEARMVHIPDGTLTDVNSSVGYVVNFKNSAAIEVNWQYNYTRLTNTFNPINENKYTSFIEGELYDWHALNAAFLTNQRKVVNMMAEMTLGQFYNGTNFNITGQVNYRYQPFGSLAIRFDYNDLKLASGYGTEKLFVVGPRLDLTFTNSLFFTTFLQYNNLNDNVGLNTRLQWRYKPASDFFIVYTENYLPENLVSKNRALVFKFTYWLNI
jgi:Domain of unknown function (DUF5916)/Carbohydrate family 9 binding domain-like